LEHDLVPATGGDDLPVATAKGALRPPAILDQPGLSDGIHFPFIDGHRLTVVVGDDRDPPGN
jgi:hypothetical protein